MTSAQLSEVRNIMNKAFDIMSEAPLKEIKPLTTALLLRHSLNAAAVAAIGRYAAASIEARNEQDDGADDDEPDFPPRRDAMLAGIAAYFVQKTATPLR